MSLRINERCPVSTIAGTRTGRPVTMLRRQAATTNWYEFVCSYVDMKRPNGEWRRPRSPSGPLTASKSSCASTPGARTAERTPRSSGSTRPWATTRRDPAKHTWARIGHRHP